VAKKCGGRMPDVGGLGAGVRQALACRFCETRTSGRRSKEKNKQRRWGGPRVLATRALSIFSQALLCRLGTLIRWGVFGFEGDRRRGWRVSASERETMPYWSVGRDAAAQPAGDHHRGTCSSSEHVAPVALRRWGVLALSAWRRIGWAPRPKRKGPAFVPGPSLRWSLTPSTV
jgi:hypothetical protein